MRHNTRCCVRLLQHACLACSRKLQIEWVDAGQLEKGAETADAAAHAAAWAKLRGGARRAGARWV